MWGGFGKQADGQTRRQIDALDMSASKPDAKVLAEAAGQAVVVLDGSEAGLKRIGS